MILKDYEKDILKKYFYKYFNEEIYLFGSHVDIDLYLKVDNKEKLNKIINKIELHLK